MGTSDSKCGFTDLYEILPAPAGLYLSSRPPRLAEPLLLKRGIGAILDVTCAHTPIEHHTSAHSPWSSKMKYLNLPVFDTEESDLKRYFGPANAFISASRDAGLGVLVHCEQGISRSSSCVIAYLVSELKMPLIEAYREVVKHRPCALPNTAFILQLMDFEEEQKGSSPSEKEECLLSVVLLERDIVPGLKDLGVTHRHLTKAILQHPGNWPLAVRVAMNDAVGETQAPLTLKLQKNGLYRIWEITTVEKTRLKMQKKSKSKRPSMSKEPSLHVIAEDSELESPVSLSKMWEPSRDFLAAGNLLTPHSYILPLTPRPSASPPPLTSRPLVPIFPPSLLPDKIAPLTEEIAT